MNKSLFMIVAVSGVGVVALCALLVVLKTYRRSKTYQQQTAGTPATTVTVSKTTEESPEKKDIKRKQQSTISDFQDFKSQTFEPAPDYRKSDHMRVEKPFPDGDHSFDKDMYSEGMSKDEANQGVPMMKVTQEQQLAGGHLLNKNVHQGGVGGPKMARPKQEPKERKPLKNIASRQKTQRKIKMVKTPVMQKTTKTGRKGKAKSLPNLPNKGKTKQKGTHAPKTGHQRKQKATKRDIKAKPPKGAEFMELVTPLEQHKLDNGYENLRPKSPGYYNLDAFL
ncbi:hypothetical protein Aduo_006808 [Ancylostoma duodenale]